MTELAANLLLPWPQRCCWKEGCKRGMCLQRDDEGPGEGQLIVDNQHVTPSKEITFLE